MESLDKTYLRRYFKDQRKRLTKDQKSKLDCEITSRFLMLEEYRKAKSVLMYMSKNDEIDTRLIVYAAFLNGKDVYAPKSLGDKKMTFHKISSISDLEAGRYGLLEPKEGLPEITDYNYSICVTPCFCIDFTGHRVGHGAGYYDRFFNEVYKGRKIALAYTNSVLPSVEYDEFDVPVDIIVTDTYTRYINR